MIAGNTDSIAAAIDRLASAQQAEADATRDLVNLRRSEIEETAKFAQQRKTDNDEATQLIADFRNELTEIAPALRMLVSIARAMADPRA